MKLVEPKISFFPSKKGCEIEIRDNVSGIRFLTVKMNQEQFCQMMGRMGDCDCEIEVFGLDKIGKKCEIRKFEFEISRFTLAPIWAYLEERCRNAMIDAGLSEWESDNYFRSQNTFFEKDGKRFARTTIRRWT